VQGVSDLEIEPDRSRAGEHHVVALAGEFQGFLDVLWEKREFGGVGVERVEVRDNSRTLLPILWSSCPRHIVPQPFNKTSVLS
jgi:hypothetical protein